MANLLVDVEKLLEAALNRGDIDALREALAAGADVNTVDKDGRSALMHADSEGHQDCSPAWMSFIFQARYLLQQPNSFTTRLKFRFSGEKCLEDAWAKIEEKFRMQHFVS